MPLGLRVVYYTGMGWEARNVLHLDPFSLPLEPPRPLSHSRPWAWVQQIGTVYVAKSLGCRCATALCGEAWLGTLQPDS